MARRPALILKANQVQLSLASFVGLPSGSPAGPAQELTPTQAVGLLPEATASVDGKMTAAQAALLLGLKTDRIFLGIEGNGFAITTGIKGDIIVPYGCTITGYTIVSDQTGSISIDLWKDTYANYPPVDADSITAAAPVTITSAVKGQDATLTGWAKSLVGGDIIRLNVDSCTSITRVSVILNVTRS